MDAINLLKFMLIALALPAQYYISQNWSSDVNQQQEALKNVLQTVMEFKKNYFELESWKKWYFSFVIERPKEYKGGRKPNLNSITAQKARNMIDSMKKYKYEDDIAIEVLQYRKNLVNFGESSETRSPRPSNIRFRVGQVVKHKELNFCGVIIGWDRRAFAPEDWLSINYEHNNLSAFKRANYMTQPHYLLLVDEKYQAEHTTKAYVAQDLLEIVVNNEIKHRLISSFFSDFDGGQYLPKKFLKTVYPND